MIFEVRYCPGGREQNWRFDVRILKSLLLVGTDLLKLGGRPGLLLWYSPGIGVRVFRPPLYVAVKWVPQRASRMPPHGPTPPPPPHKVNTHFTSRSSVSFRFDVPLLARFNFFVPWYLNNLQAESMPYAPVTATATRTGHSAPLKLRHAPRANHMLVSFFVANTVAFCS